MLSYEALELPLSPFVSQPKNITKKNVFPQFFPQGLVVIVAIGYLYEVMSVNSTIDIIRHLSLAHKTQLCIEKQVMDVRIEKNMFFNYLCLFLVTNVWASWFIE
jgi:hypothetical protein